MSGHEVKQPEREVMDGDETANLLGIHPETLAEWSRRGRIPAFKPAGGRMWRYRRSRILRWMEEEEQGQQEQRQRQQKSA